MLKAFSRTDRELGVTQLARRLGLGISTVHRLLATLATEGLLERGDGGTYRLGLQVYELGVTVFPNLDLHEAALPVLASLRETTGESVQMGVLDQLDVVYVERLEGPRTVWASVAPATDCPAHATSTGKALLAHLPGDILGPGWPTGIRRASPRTRSPTGAFCSTSCVASPSGAGRRTSRRVSWVRWRWRHPYATPPVTSWRPSAWSGRSRGLGRRFRGIRAAVVGGRDAHLTRIGYRAGQDR